MTISPDGPRARATVLRCGASLLVLGAVAAVPFSAASAQSTVQQAPVPAAAPASDNAAATNIHLSGETSPAPNTNQEATSADTTQDTGNDVIVTGTRAALQTSQNIKRNADTLVDSITATDIGAFPDKSVAEALQRVPGITVNRFAASDDTSHFSADPSGVIIRGLTQVRSEFNGRDTFSANSSRGLSWEDLSPELLAGVDTYKNQTAELIEGGIAGSINLRSRLPFDNKGQVLELNARANYGDISKKVTPDLSAVYSNRWNTGIGEFGLMADVAWSKVQTESQGIVYGRTAVFDGVYGPGMQYIPSSVGYRDTVYDRTRTGIALAGQWRNNDGSLLATAQYNRSKFSETWREHGVISYLTDLYAYPANFAFTTGGANASHIPRAAPGSAPFTFDDQGNFETGLLVHQQTDFSWWGSSDPTAPDYTGTVARNASGGAFFTPCYSWQPTCTNDVGGLDVNAVTRYNESKRMTQDASFNLKWNASDRLDFNFDAQYIDSTVRNYDVEVGQYSYANVLLDASGDRPTMTFSAPTNVNLSTGGLGNANNYHYNHVMDHIEDDEGTEWAFRGDANYRIESDWLASLKVGVRYADRDQTVRYSAYNWGAIAQPYNTGQGQSAYWNIDNYVASGAFKGYPQGLTDQRNFGGDFFGGTNQFVFFNMNALEQRGANALSYSNLGAGVGQWEPVCSNGGTAMTGPRTGETPGTCFRPDEINRISETTKAAYAQLKFGGSNARILGIGVSGNIGVRYVETRDKVSGSTVFPNAYTTGTNPCTRNTQGTVPYSVGCYIFGNATLLATPVRDAAGNIIVFPNDYAVAPSTAVTSFASGTGQSGESNVTHHNWLPSFNLKLDLSSTWLLRFAASRAMSRPDIGLLKNYTTISAQLPGNDASDSRYIKDATGRITGVAPLYQASGYNPTLKPITATQFDLSLENYFSKVGSFSAAVFYKKFQNYIQYGSRFVDFTNNGVTNSIEVRGPMNGEGGKVYGAEAAFQTFFDFLPGPFDGLGIQVNGTFVKNEGITNSGLKAQNGTNGGSQAQDGSGGTTLSVNSLEGLSKWTYNLVGMYEKSGIAARVAYNWRSSFLVTAVDCCTYLPTWQKAAGYLDASIRYAINNNIELSIQGTNLLNTQTKLQQQVTGADAGAILTPNAWFQNDRRYIAGVRVKF